jgi:hypothetical protein
VVQYIFCAKKGNIFIIQLCGLCGFYIIIYANLCSYYINQTCDEIEIGIVGKWKFSFERCNFCFHMMYSLKDI